VPIISGIPHSQGGALTNIKHQQIFYFSFSFFLTIPSKCPPDIRGIMKEKNK
jgi:hypothetical protein